MVTFTAWMVITYIATPPNTSHLIPRLGPGFSFRFVPIQLLLPIAGEIAMLIMLSLPGTKGDNRHGPRPSHNSDQQGMQKTPILPVPSR